MRIAPSLPRTSLAAATLAAVGLGLAAAPSAAAGGVVPPAKNIILFIGDGMQLAHEVAGSRYLTGSPAALSFHQLDESAAVTTWDVSAYNHYAPKVGAPPYDPATFLPSVGYDPMKGGYLPYPMIPETATMRAYFLNAGNLGVRYTDSASAATAWATGYKTDDGNVAWLPGDPPDGALKTIAELMREQKRASIGVVSTVPFTHATPAAHVAHNKSRNNYSAIGHEIITRVKPDVVIGGGHPDWQSGYLASADYDRLKNPQNYQNRPDYVFVERMAGQDGAAALQDAADLATQRRMRLFGLFGGAGGNFEYHVPAHDPGNPAFARGSTENPLLKDCVEAALTVLSKDRDGFFVMFEQGDIDWANHGNEYANMLGGVWDLHLAVQQAIDFINEPGDQVDWDNTLLIVTSDHANSYMRVGSWSALGKGYVPTWDGNSIPRTYDAGNVYYGTGSHTDELVMLYAQGAGANLFNDYKGAWYPGTSMIDNTHIFEVMAAAVGVVAP